MSGSLVATRRHYRRAPHDAGEFRTEAEYSAARSYQQFFQLQPTQTLFSMPKVYGLTNHFNLVKHKMRVQVRLV